MDYSMHLENCVEKKKSKSLQKDIELTKSLKTIYKSWLQKTAHLEEEDPQLSGSLIDLDDILEEKTVEIKCECGAWATYGNNCSSWFHQEYCPLYIPKVYR